MKNYFLLEVGVEEDVYKRQDLAYKLMNELQDTVIKGKSLDKQSVTYSLSLLLEGSEMMIKELDDVIVVTKKGKAVQPKTLGQKKYIELINQNDITFGIGPAGTGKTYLAVAMAVSAFKKDEVNRIVLTRPAVEAGESLGFLPGDLKDKVDPCLLYTSHRWSRTKQSCYGTTKRIQTWCKSNKTNNG